VDSLLCVPSLLAILLDERVPRTGRSLHALRQVIVAGETCPASLVARAARALPAATLFNEYGPTEATVWATVHRCTGAASAASVPIGRPIPNAHIHILDPQGRQVPAGDTGEIHIGGAGVARGYVNRPDLTAERFLPDPFTADGTGRLYRTGDLGCWRRDGAIEFHGRIDHQLKIRGIRVEPGEIEAALLHHPCVREAAALAQDDAHLVAYVTLRGGPVSPAALSAHLAATLPDYMLPSRIVQVAAFPLTPNGKLDRAALAVLAPLPGSVPPGPPPRTPDEALLCRLFARLTGHDCVDVNSDFFEIGGDSLDAMILLTELRQSGRDLPLGQLFATRTPAAIAASWSPDPPPPPDAARPTLFIIPGSGSYDPRLAVLLLDWAPQIDCVLLDYPDWPVLSDPGFGMDALLAHFAARIAAHDHRGKLLLAGYSLGGFVAWALARRLARTPRPLDLLAIIDSDYSQLQQAMTPEAAASRAARRLHAATTLLGVEGGAEAARMLGEIAAYRLAIRPATLRFLARFRRLRLPPRFRTWLRMILCGELQTGIVTRWRAAESSVPETLLCRRVVLFQAVANENRAPHGRGWPARCASLAIEDVTGDHATLLGCRDPQSLYAKLPLALAEAAAVPGDRAMNPAECAQVSDAVT
jgi:thioesterase domain-containing protein/aryl carrier-like protein